MQIYTCLVLLFTVSELGLLLSKRSKTVSVKSKVDKNSLLFLWVAIPVCLTLAGFIAGFRIWMFTDASLVIETGIAVAIIGFIIRWAAIIQLGKMFTVDVAISSTHILKTDGLYKIVRHPSYLGLMLIIAGLGLCMGSILSLTVTLVPIFIAMNYRIVVEEKALTEEFGIQYKEYRKNVSKIIPWLY